MRLASRGIREELTCEKVSCGTGEGAWLVHPDGLGADSVVYSFGLGTDISFDLDMIRRWGAPVHGFDPTPASLAWLHTQQLPESFHIHPYGLGAVDGDVTFFPPRRATSSHFSPVPRYRESGEGSTFPVRRLSSIVHEMGHKRIDLLKIDIEGGEYDVIGDIVRCTVPVRQLLLEFHHCYATIPLSRTIEALGTLRAHGFRIFAISERTYEISMLHVSQNAIGQSPAEYS